MAKLRRKLAEVEKNYPLPEEFRGMKQYFTVPLPFLQDSSGICRNGTGIELELSEIRYNTFARYIYTNMHFCTL